MRFAPILAAAVLAACAGHHRGLCPEAAAHLESAPLVLVHVQSGGVLDWQKERDGSIPVRLEQCLPTALAPLCPGVCEVREQSGTAEPHVVLTAETVYLASAHFMYGFRLHVTYVLMDRTGTQELARFSYVYEPLQKVMAEQGDLTDEVLTFDAVLTADRVCDEIGTQALEIASQTGK